jgi:putative peptidoglycan lipid II flippase
MGSNEKVSQAAGSVSGMTLISRIFGFLRDSVIAMMFGASASADAFFVAFRIPNMQRKVLGEGAISAAFIPVFSAVLQKQGNKSAWQLAACLFNILLVALFLVTLIIFIFAPAVVTVFAPGFLEFPEKFQQTVLLTRWMAPYLIFIGIASFFMGILNTFKFFALPAVAPTLLNLSMIISALFISPLMEEPIIGLAIGVLAGGFLQMLIQIPTTIRLGMKFVGRFELFNPEVKKIGRLMIPVILGLAVYEVNLLVDTLLASLLPEGSISYLYYGNRLVQLPLGVFAVALGVALLPMLSSHAAKKEYKELITTLSFGIRLILFITIPAVVGMILLRFPIINTLWERGEFSRATTEGTAIALLYYSIGLCAFSGIKVIVPAYYSLQDTKTPAKIAIYSMVTNIILNLILMGPLKHGGLALATSISALLNVVLLIHFLRKRLGLLGGRKILSNTLKVTLASALMGILIFYFNAGFFDPAAALGMKVFILTLDVALGVGAFWLFAYLLKIDELAFIGKLIKNRRSAQN